MSLKNTLALFIIMICLASACTSNSGSNTKHADRLLGVWHESNAKDGSSFEIKKDSIYYTEDYRLSVYKYAATKDSIKVFFDDYVYTAKLYVSKDTLIMDSPLGGIATYLRIKK